ncbi:hypothetical protein C0J52_17682 [Blattella germanica]|nr:hypothetical protein C0J52_17682 [Blattella germanica]
MLSSEEDNAELQKERQSPSVTYTGQIGPSLESELSKGPVNCSPLSKSNRVSSGIRQRVNAQTVLSNLRSPLADLDLLRYCNNCADLPIIESIQNRFLHSKCNKDNGIEVRKESGESKCLSVIGDGSLKCASDDISIVNQRRSHVPTRRRRSIVTEAPATRVNRQENLCHGEIATKDMCDDRPHTLVFETGHRNLTVGLE